jgi:hypothetical protein
MNCYVRLRNRAMVLDEHIPEERKASPAEAGMPGHAG